MNSSHYFNLIHVFKKKGKKDGERRPSQSCDEDDFSGSDESMNRVGLPSPSPSPPSPGFYSPNMRQSPSAATPALSTSPPKKNNDRFLQKLSSHLNRSSKGPQEHIHITNGYERLG